MSKHLLRQACEHLGLSKMVFIETLDWFFYTKHISHSD